jgi:hypothetical protein
MATVGRVTGVADRLDADGSQFLEIVTLDGTRLEAKMPAESLDLFFRTMQKNLIERIASKAEGSVSLPEFQVTGLNLAHKGHATELMVSTAQFGSLVLILSDDALLMLKKQIERVKLHRSGPKSQN